MKRIAYWTIFLWALGQISGNVSCLADDAKDSATPVVKKNVLRIDDMYPVNGPGGNRRHTSFVAGEKIHFAAKILGIGEKPDGETKSVFWYSLSTPSGQKGHDRMDPLGKNKLPLRGGVSTVYFSFDTDISFPQGQYTVHLTVVDLLENQQAEKTLDINISDEIRFCILSAGLTADQDVRYPSTGNTTLGQGVHIIYITRVPKDKKNEVNAEALVTVFDHNNRVVYRDSKPHAYLKKDKDVGENGLDIVSIKYFRIPEIGSYRIHIEVKNLSTNETDQCDLPLVVHALPGMLQTAVEPAATESQSNAQGNGDLQPDKGMNKLQIDAWPSYGDWGAPGKNTFISGEPMSFGLSFHGLSGNADRKTDCDSEIIFLDSNSSTNFNGKEHVKKLPMKGILFLPRTQSLVETYTHRSSLPPGRYTARFVIKDNIANKTASKDVPITVVGNDTFALSRVGLTKDKERNIWAGSNLTVGDSIFAGGEIFLPKSSSGHDVEVTAFFLDANRKELTRMIPFREKNVISPASYPYEPLIPKFAQPFTPNCPGSYFVRFELKDMKTQETVTKELPFNVFLPPELDAQSQKDAISKSKN